MAFSPKGHRREAFVICSVRGGRQPSLVHIQRLASWGKASRRACVGGVVLVVRVRHLKAV